MVFSDIEKQVIREIVREEIDESLEELKKWLSRECRT